MNENILSYEQTLIACRAFFSGSEKSFHGVICYKDGHPVVFVEIDYGWDGTITYDVWFYPDHSKSVYSVSYDKMCSRLKYLARIL
jgi:hypothetical protein